MSSLVVSSQANCPPRHLSTVIVGSIDQTVEAVALINIQDPKLLFFRKTLRFREEEIHHVFEDAISFFNHTFGLDFSNSQPNGKNQHYLENTEMYPVVLHENIN